MHNAPVSIETAQAKLLMLEIDILEFVDAYEYEYVGGGNAANCY